MPVLCRPAVAVPEYTITRQETLDPARTLHAGHESLPLVLRLIGNTGVARRHLVRPIEHTLAHPGFEARNALCETEAEARVPAVGRGHGGSGILLEHNGSHLVPDSEDRIADQVRPAGFHFTLDKRVPAPWSGSPPPSSNSTPGTAGTPAARSSTPTVSDSDLPFDHALPSTAAVA